MGNVLHVKLCYGDIGICFAIYLYNLFQWKSRVRHVTEKELEIAFKCECIATITPCTKYTLKQKQTFFTYWIQTKRFQCGKMELTRV